MSENTSSSNRTSNGKKKFFKPRRDEFGNENRPRIKLPEGVAYDGNWKSLEFDRPFLGNGGGHASCKKSYATQRSVARHMSWEEVKNNPFLESFKRTPKSIYKTLLGGPRAKRRVKNVRMPAPKQTGKKR